MKNYIRINIAMQETEITELLIAQLSELNFDGFEETENYLLAYCDENVFNEAALQKLFSFHKLSFTKEIIKEQNWNTVWEKNFEPITIDDFVAVRAAFHKPVLNAEHEIIITPKMSFGTGHHATTFMMMQQMREMNFKNKSVLDFGTGTGILSILAEKSGAASVTAIDNDEWSIINAKENIGKNKSRFIHLLQSNFPEPNKKYDIVLANINKNIILENLSKLVNTLHPGGYLLLSGLLLEDETDIAPKTVRSGLKHINTIKKDNWISMLFGN